MKRFEIYSENKIINLDSPFIACIDTTMVCQQACKFCYNSKEFRIKRCVEHPKLETLSKILDEVGKAGIFEIDLMGGEPLSLPKTHLLEIVKKCKQYNIKINLVSNMLGANDFFCKEIAPHIKDIGFSLHAPNTKLHDEIVGVKGAYTLATKNFVNVAEKTDCSLGILFSGIKSNMYLVEDTADAIVKKLGKNKNKLKFFYLNRMVCHKESNAAQYILETNLTKEEHWQMIKQLFKIKEKYPWMNVQTNDSYPICEIRKLYAKDKEIYKTYSFDEIKKFIGKCYFGKTNIAIKSNGNAVICTVSRDSDYIQNIFKKTLKGIWQGQLYSKYRKLKWMPEMCYSCQDLDDCFGGCKMGKKGPFGIDRWIEEDDIKMNRVLRNDNTITKINLLKINDKEYQIREEGKEYIIYLPGIGHVFRPGKAILITKEELILIKNKDKKVMNKFEELIKF